MPSSTAMGIPQVRKNSSEQDRAGEENCAKRGPNAMYITLAVYNCASKYGNPKYPIVQYFGPFKGSGLKLTVFSAPPTSEALAFIIKKTQTQKVKV